MKRILFFAVIFLGLGISQGEAQVSINEQPEVSSIMTRYVSQNKARTETSGWRVQILSTSDRRKMEQVKSDLIRKYPQFTPVWTFDAPNYKLKVGACRNKLETERIKYIIKKEFPSAFSVKDDKINPIEFM